ncbi:MAG TPA: hypothetical protein VNH20_05820 [Candidatus Dormibacteraeota bacterium]|nr:hypothetical protein [Candidatus Dormibacteraeota bacterium]
MFDGSLYLLAKERGRELRDAGLREQSGRELARIDDQTRQRRVAAARRLLASAVRRG